MVAARPPSWPCARPVGRSTCPPRRRRRSRSSSTTAAWPTTACTSGLLDDQPPTMRWTPRSAPSPTSPAACGHRPPARPTCTTWPDQDGPQRRIVLDAPRRPAGAPGPGTVTAGPGQVILPDWYLRIGGVEVGDRVALTVPAPVQVDVGQPAAARATGTDHHGADGRRHLPGDPGASRAVVLVRAAVVLPAEQLRRSAPPARAGGRVHGRRRPLRAASTPTGSCGRIRPASPATRREHAEPRPRPPAAAYSATTVAVTVRQLRDSQAYTSGLGPVPATPSGWPRW